MAGTPRSKPARPSVPWFNGALRTPAPSDDALVKVEEENEEESVMVEPNAYQQVCHLKTPVFVCLLVSCCCFCWEYTTNFCHVVKEQKILIRKQLSSGAHYPEPPSALYPLVNPFPYLFMLFWRSQCLRNNNGSEYNNWCRGAKTPGRNRRRSVLEINIYRKGLTPRVSMGDGGSK